VRPRGDVFLALEMLKAVIQSERMELFFLKMGLEVNRQLGV